MKDLEWKAKRLTYGNGWIIARIDENGNVVESQPTPYASKRAAKMVADKFNADLSDSIDNENHDNEVNHE